MATATTTTTMAIRPPVEMDTALPELPEAPPSVPFSTPGAVEPPASPTMSSGKSSSPLGMNILDTVCPVNQDGQKLSTVQRTSSGRKRKISVRAQSEK